jgi:hypothetical protein
VTRVAFAFCDIVKVAALERDVARLGRGEFLESVISELNDVAAGPLRTVFPGELSA